MLALLAALLTQAPADGGWPGVCRVTADPYFPDAGNVLLCDLPIYAHRFGATLDTHLLGITYDNGHPIPQYLSLESENGTPHSGTMPGRVLELHGYEEDTDAGHPWRSGVEIYCLGRGYRPATNGNSCVGIGSTPSSAKVFYFTNRGDFFSEGGTFTLNSDDNEKRLVAISSLGPAATARLQLKGQCQPGTGPCVYVTPSAALASGNVFGVLNYGQSTGFYVTASGAAKLGRLPTWALPACTVEASGDLLNDTTRDCTAVCRGGAWKCLQVEP